ncbi:BLUF domain-containing protein [Rubellimicrobium aerolatum]|uniref:BLUF domain-containing protein n=1 Tax=Rubellimicrobium aerolatum TaxID=490979 RepID=A0ABW0SG13_9RHOB|nr:BLUF domain-containing protein [Rubellimicrobium aerolatum]MBP1807054.1 hypothetical protein [Rubellimicrobium aerolatum]
MSDPLSRLVYVSRNLMGGPPERTRDGLRDILEVSRRNNAAQGVTGALLFNRGCFAQVLEGPRAAVERTFERIQRDLRHGDMALLSFGPVAERGFPAWSMGFVGTDAGDRRHWDGLTAESGFDPALLRAEEIYGTLLRGMVEDEAIP